MYCIFVNEMKAFFSILLVWTFFVPLTANAQKGNFVGIQTGITRPFYLGNNGEFIFSAHQGYSFLASFEYHKENPLYFGARLGLNQFGSEYFINLNFEDEINPNRDFVSATRETYDLPNIRYNYYSMPLFIGYSESFNKVGISTNFALMPSIIKVVGDDLGFQYAENRFDIGAQLEFGAFLMVKEKIKIAPSLNYYFGFIQRTSIFGENQQAWCFNLNVSYRLGEL